MTLTIPEIIEQSQQIVATYKPHGYYEIYRPTETEYWGDIPKWISELSPSPKTVLDVGCAYGTMLVFCRAFSTCDLYAVDVHPYISLELVGLYNIRYCVGFNIETDIFPWHQKFDLILFTEVLEHLECRPEVSLIKMADLLSPQGKIILSTPNKKNYGATQKDDYKSLEEIPFIFDEGLRPEKQRHSHHFLYNEEELRTVVYNSGLAFDKLDGIKEKHLIAMLRKDEQRWASHREKMVYL